MKRTPIKQINLLIAGCDKASRLVAPPPPISHYFAKASLLLYYSCISFRHKGGWTRVESCGVRGAEKDGATQRNEIRNEQGWSRATNNSGLI